MSSLKTETTGGTFSVGKKLSKKFSDDLLNLQLPYLNEKIIFKKGETERLLNFQFYNTSYKACCEIAKQSDIPNSSMKKNYRDNWRLVEQFAHEQENKKIKEVKEGTNLEKMHHRFGSCSFLFASKKHT